MTITPLAALAPQIEAAEASLRTVMSAISCGLILAIGLLLFKTLVKASGLVLLLGNSTPSTMIKGDLVELTEVRPRISKGSALGALLTTNPGTSPSSLCKILGLLERVAMVSISGLEYAPALRSFDSTW